MSDVFNPSKRRLCPDGTCIGLLDPSGRCNECGRDFGPGAAAAGGQDLPEGSQAADQGGDQAGDQDGGQTGGQTGGQDGGSGNADNHVSVESSDHLGVSAGAAFDPGSGFDPSRRLCDDGACVGVVGQDGTCTVCGRVARS